MKHTRSNLSQSLRAIRGLTDRLKDLWICWRELWKKLWLHQLKEPSNNFFKYTGLQQITRHQPHNLLLRWCSHVRYSPFMTNYSWNRQSLEEHASYPQYNTYNPGDKVIFRIFKDNKSFWKMVTIKKRVGNMIHIIKGPQFTHKSHLNQLRKCLTDEADRRPPEETVIDIIHDTFDIPTSLAVPEMCCSKRKRKQLI